MTVVTCARLRDVPPETLYRVMWLRVSVFVVEQRAAYPELDGRDLETDAELLWIEEDGDVVATARLLLDAAEDKRDATARIGRVATAHAARGRGFAAYIMRAAVARSAERWPNLPVALDAQTHLADWYARFGFEVCGAGFLEDDIPHVPMRRLAVRKQRAANLHS